MIGVFKKKSELPEYLSHYGMFRAPFSTAVEDDMYYVEPTRKQRLDILLHLTQYTSELLVVIAEEGMGKTMFLNQFIKSAAEHWKICHIDGHKMMTEEQFLQRVYIGFGIAHASIHKSAMLTNLKKRLDNLLQQSLPVILLVDNAHLFSNKVLSLILDIASIKNIKTGSSVRVILFSEPQIKIMLAEPELDERHRLIVRKIDLPPLDEMHTGNYLHHRLSQAGMATEQFLTKNTISKIYKQSGGVPLRINEAADKLLFETTPIIRRTSHVQAESRMASRKYLILAALAGILVVILLMPHLINGSNNGNDSTEKASPPSQIENETVTPLKLPELESQETTGKSESAAKSVTNKNEQTDPMQALKDELAAKTAENAVQDTPLRGKPSTKQAAPSPAPATAETSTTNAISETAVTTTPTTATPPAILTKTSEATTKQPGYHDAKWILDQKADTFTLQLVTARQQTTITNFIKKYQLNPDQLAYFYSRRNGNAWHNLTFGIYPSRKAASDAIKQLPQGLEKVKPWIRQLRSIQTEIIQSR